MSHSREYKEFYAASGVTPGDKIPNRKDFRDLSNDEKYLYIEGLKRFQNVEPEDPLSWFQIAGIHGLPYQTWPPREKEIKATGDGGGFCTHSSILFLTWHRPYLALFEAALYDHVKAIAEGITENQQKWLALAKEFRMPYWDWARKDKDVPVQILDERYRPEGPRSSKSVPKERGNYNPLLTYTYPEGPLDVVDDDSLRAIKSIGDQTFGSTVRSSRFKSRMVAFSSDPSRSDPKVKNQTLNRPGVMPLELQGKVEGNLSERTAYILQSYQNFYNMSDNSLRKTPKTNRPEVDNKENWGSLEDIHNVVHVTVGGHMGNPATAAFDPIFWMHHTNIDRLFTIWQALHDDGESRDYVDNTIKWTSGGTFTSIQGKDIDTSSTELYPFKTEAQPKSWYTSEKAKRTEEFGYSYPETAGLTNYPISAKEKTKLAKRINNMYSSMPWELVDSMAKKSDAGAQFLARSAVVSTIETTESLLATPEIQQQVTAELPPLERLLEKSNAPGKPVLRDLVSDRKYLEWIVNMKAVKHALNGRYSVHVFLGSADDEPNPLLWTVVPSHVGTFTPFGQPSNTACDKCQQDQEANLQVTSQIPLTIALVERYLGGIIPDLTPEKVIPYLQRNLHWRVALDDGTFIQDQSQVTGLTVFVITNEVTLPSDSEGLPRYAPDVTVYPEITTNAAGRSRGHGTGLTAAYA